MAFEQAVSRRAFLSALGLIPALRDLSAQQQDKPTFSSGVNVVNLFANVRNKTGGIVKDLTKDDFLLDEDGRAQEIRYFSQESDLPLTLGLLVDTSGSQRRLIDEERAASYRFFEQVLRPEKDVAFVIHFDFETELLQDLTASRKLLEKALENLEAPAQQQRQSTQQQPMPFPFPGGGGRRRGGGGRPPMSGGGRSGGTVLYDAVLLAANELMRKQAGRKALVVLTDGVDTGSKVSLSAAVEAAQRADTLVCSILFEDPAAYGGGGIGMGRMGGGRIPVNTPNGKKVLEQISRETGGRFEVSKKHALAQVYDEIDEDLRHQYSLGYSPDRAQAGGGYHRIHLTTRQKGLTVQTREGYYGA